MKTRAVIVFLLLIFLTNITRAGFVELNVFYSSDGLKTTGTESATQMFIDGAIGINIDKKGRYQVGWNYGMFSTTQKTASADIQYSSTQMGPKFNVYFNKDRTWGLGLSYNLITNATYDNGSEEEWRGTAIKGDLGYLFWLNETSAVGLRLNYVSASYDEQFINDTLYAKISYTRTHMYPSLYLTYDF